MASFLKNEILRSGLEMAAIRHYFLHQANAHMNQLILKRLLGSEPDPALAPLILDEFANTSSAGSVIALYRHQQQIQAGEYALLLRLVLAIQSVVPCCVKVHDSFDTLIQSNNKKAHTKYRGSMVMDKW